MKLIVSQGQLSDINEILACYDDANLLYPPKQRAKGTAAIIETVLSTNNVFIIKENLQVIGWIAYKIDGQVAILNGLYVRRQYHGKKVSTYLVDFYHDQICSQGIKYSFLSYIKGAVWAEKFYHSMAYQRVDEINKTLDDDVIEMINKKKRSYSQILIRHVG